MCPSTISLSQHSASRLISPLKSIRIFHTAFSSGILVSTQYGTCNPMSYGLNFRSRAYFPPVCCFGSVHTVIICPFSLIYIPETVKLCQTASYSWRISFTLMYFLQFFLYLPFYKPIFTLEDEKLI